jgi:hypothetical protein
VQSQAEPNRRQLRRVAHKQKPSALRHHSQDPVEGRQVEHRALIYDNQRFGADDHLPGLDCLQKDRDRRGLAAGGLRHPDRRATGERHQVDGATELLRCSHDRFQDGRLADAGTTDDQAEPAGQGEADRGALLFAELDA